MSERGAVASSGPTSVAAEAGGTVARHCYVHVPFCARRCSYCDFAIAVRRVVPVADFLDGLERERAMRIAAGPAAELETLYLGGGTPSRLGADGVQRVLDLVCEVRPLAAGAEVTIEANPEDVTPSAARGWVAAGVNRVSLGVQSFDAAVLRWMHRTHGAPEVRRAVDELRAAGIGELSIDLIFAVPSELGRDWGRDLAAAMALEADHVSVYGLTVEARTPLGRWVERGTTAPADEERYAAEFLEAHAALGSAGYTHYEVSNYARRDPGGERRARHNSAYWRGVPYHALGPGAHGFDGAVRWWNRPDYAGWLAELREGRAPEAGRERLDAAARAVERVYLGLRTVDGLALTPAEEPVAAGWVSAGWAEWGDAGRLRLTAEGWLRLDALAGALTSLSSHCEL